MWADIADLVLGADARIAFDDRIRLIMPSIAEDQHSFPVLVDARAIPGVVRIVIFADLNPLQLALDYRPADAEPFIATRIKLDQRTPVRGAVQLADGRWLVAARWIDAAGGGCSAPPASRVRGDWTAHLGEVRGGLWQGPNWARLDLAFRHPMDTGFVSGIPSYHLEQVVVRTSTSRPLGELRMQASVAEDPVFTILPHLRLGESVLFEGRDTNGIEYRGRIDPKPASAR